MEGETSNMGNLSARMDNVERELGELKSGVASILAILNQAKGGWRVILGICAVVGGVFGMIEVFLKK